MTVIKLGGSPFKALTSLLEGAASFVTESGFNNALDGTTVYLTIEGD